MICHDSVSMTTTTATTLTTLLTTPDSTVVNARWAPITSLLSRLTSEPVWVRVKNAMGWDCTWSKTSVRRS